MSTVVAAYDKAGNLQFDGRYYFHYDAFNRLVQINAAEWDTAVSPAVIVYGDTLRRYRYDGFGRLIRTESPLRPGSLATGYFTEDFYYDGVRRIQEIVTDPDATGQPKLAREYVWGPGDGGGGGFDELLVQFDGDTWLQRDKGWWSLHDTSGDMVALCDIDSSAGRVVAQWS